MSQRPIADTMQALVAEGPNRFSVTEVPTPRPGEEDVLIQIASTTICGSDIKLLRGQMEDIVFPLIPGHEWYGEVVTAPARLQKLVGQIVVADILQGCGCCAYCDDGLPNLCPELVEPGLSASGSYAEYLAVPASTVLPLPPGLGGSLACLVEPLSVVLFALERVPVHDGEHVLILGGGGIGQLLALMARSRGARRVVLVDPHPARRELALRMSADEALPPEPEQVLHHYRSATVTPPDLVFEAAGNADAITTALAVVRPAGRVGLLGYAGADDVVLPSSIFMRKLLDVRGILSPTGTWRQSIETLAERVIDPAPLVTHECSLEAFDAAFRLSAERRDGAVRVAVAPRGAS